MNRHSELWAAWNVGTVAGVDLIVHKRHNLYIGYLGGKPGMRSKNPGSLMDDTLKDLAPFGEVVLNYDDVADLVTRGRYDDRLKHNIKQLCEKLIRESTAGSAA